MSKAYLGIGTNMGDKFKNIKDTLELLSENNRINITKVSSYYETEPVGYANQDWFLNVVCEIETNLLPYPLLDYCAFIEQALKRERIIRWGPRIIDVDILLYEDFTSTDEKLTLPHPRMIERNFVMIPLYEINNNLVINGEPIKNIIDRLNGEEIRKVNHER
ncbi:MAG: 2-amino-4-hydroxy-6-hydroxymethyldihydropteridine diphosphokinase [Anaeromicrobium sp.]|jgi:2-amino-4-hydroxy-6-hydroxymethyldihydropteridine diphosphokinase|uniref:2-amino-4-hydroxy-6- hydroxymethyldihydropteridine diphosphokinase n=1 Tax=Anaeromicrobium sp. TaxID=1929132 RepID=UPI0025F756F8|nr:2-amino-4-hydroxy-6-hydroxymethyldihydropteridine diphosphokinase [Anaeromicrobium sp.]MCT4593779.1 2-amino-4-hydroxy-6-hydroxymethyldihydropteridine diphosphokinase [Anaeromicrobium sp.]